MGGEPAQHECGLQINKAEDIIERRILKHQIRDFKEPKEYYKIIAMLIMSSVCEIGNLC